MKNLEKAAGRIKQAVAKKENIVLFSDADMDGVASLLILQESIEFLGGKIKKVYFPNREIEGYGLSEKALKNLVDFAPGLLILSDTGITNFKEIIKAKKIGFSVLLIDHHEVVGFLPKADIIINPKQEGDNYPFKLFAAAGLCFCLAKYLLAGKNEILENELVLLAALATIADMMPQECDNREIISQGLSFLSKSERPSFLAFREIFLKEATEDKRFSEKIISLLQLTDFVGCLTESYLLLREDNFTRLKSSIKTLEEKQRSRKNLTQAFVDEISAREIGKASPFVFYGEKDIPHLLTGSIASKVLQKTKKTTFIYSQKAKLSRGSCRAYRGINVVSALRACAVCLDMFGGHPPAAGFTIQNKNLKKFGDCLKKYFVKI